MTTAQINISDKENESIKCRALLDTCSTVNLISERVANLLKLPKKKCSIPVGALNELSTTTKHIVTATIKSLHNDYFKTLEFLTIPTISHAVPNEALPRENIPVPANIKLADPEFYKPAPIDILLGSGPTLSLFSIGQHKIVNKNLDLCLQKTRLGWVIGGYVNCNKREKTATCNFTDLQFDLENFWKIEEGPMQVYRSAEETFCENHFAENTTRDKTGRYIVALPFRRDNNGIGESRLQALERLHSLFKRFNKNPDLYHKYNAVIQEYIQLNHMSETKVIAENGYYLPHHAVIKESSATTKLRVVFDASAKTSNGYSLNDNLAVGPTIQDDIFSHLLRFRTHKYVLSADIEKMYRQVLVREEDRKYQQILWKVGNEIKTYQLNTVTFGLAPAPYLAIRCLIQLADDEGRNHPIAAEKLKRDMYVDNLLTGAETIKEARVIREEITELLKQGGFPLRQWAASDPRILYGLNGSEINTHLQLNDDKTLKTLGISWNAKNDSIIYTVNSVSSRTARSKRAILSEIAKIFDPLGLLGPIILYAKNIMQDLWKEKLHWDESVPINLYTKWTEFYNQLPLINNIEFPRKTIASKKRAIQLHGFCDASTKGYGACIYLRSISDKGDIKTVLLGAKSRVAPVKESTIPRLELCAALLLVNLFKQVKSAIEISFDKIVFWSDSSITLHWIKTSPHLLKTFVANRVAEIQGMPEPHTWKHIRTEYNPADALSRGQLPAEFLNNKMWFNGPEWLCSEENFWPKTQIPGLDENLPEVRKGTCLLSEVIDKQMDAKLNKRFEVFERFSSYSRLKRFVAYTSYLNRTKKYKGSIQVQDLIDAEKTIIKRIQSVCFVEDINHLCKNIPIKKQSRLLSLSPFIDKDKIVRVGGRLKYSCLSYNQKHPIILPRSNHVTDLIIKELHENNHHAGIQTTLCLLRQKFWLLDGKAQIRKIIRRCVRCFRSNPLTTEYQMGELPRIRLSQSRVFSNVGIDYCGPFYIKEKKYRNTKQIKVYVAVFVCLATKAVHLELASDLTTEGFLAALRRFLSRRGKPKNIYSDNATNFVGANNELKEIYALITSDKHQKRTNKFFSDNEINWHFIPPSSPHFGGLWESTVKLFKHHMKRVVTNLLFTFEELNTFVIEVEAILNSRPLTAISTDPNDPPVLTPAHFLIGDSFTSLPEGDLTDIQTNRLSRWQHITQIRQHFWKRWHKEYLNELNIRHKWATGQHSIKKNSIVLLAEDNVPSMQWVMGQVIEVHPGSDGVIRAATVRTSTSVLKRTVKKLALLPIIDNFRDN